MAREEGITIPRNPEKDELLKATEEMSYTNEQTYDLLSWQGEYAKKTKEATQKMAGIQEKQEKAVSPVMGFFRKTIANPTQLKYQKIKNKITEAYNKHIVKGKFFQKLGTHLKKIAQQTGSFLWKFLKGLLLLAVFDPKGKLLKKIVGMVSKVAGKIVDAFIANAPKIMDAIMHILTTVLPDVTKKLFSALIGSVKKMFEAGIGTGLVGLAGMLFLMSKIPIVGGLVSKSFELLGNALGKFANKILAKVGPTILKGLASLGASLKTFAIALLTNPITWIVLAIVGALVALWIWKDKIAKFFESIFDWFSKLSTGMKILIGVLALVFWPITLVAGAIYGLVKLFQSFAKIGVAETFKLIWESIKEAFSNIGSAIADIAGTVWDSVINFFKMAGKFLWKWFKKAIKGYLNLIKKVFWDFPMWLGEKIADGFIWLFVDMPKKLGNIIRDAVFGVFDTIKGFFNDVIIWFKTIANVGLGSYLVASDEKRERAKQATRAIEAVEEIREKGGKIPKELAKYVTAGKGGVDFEALMDKMGKREIEIIEKKVKEVEQRAETTVEPPVLPYKKTTVLKKRRRK